MMAKQFKKCSISDEMTGKEVRKKMGMFAVNIKVWEVWSDTENLNCEDIEAETWAEWDWQS